MKDYITIHINKKSLKTTFIVLMFIVVLAWACWTIWVVGNNVYDDIYNKGYDKGLGEETSSCVDDLSNYEFIDMSGEFTEYVGYYPSVICTEGCSYLDLESINGGWINNYDEVNCGCYVKDDALVSGDEQDE